MILATNTGSLYTYLSDDKNTLIFASEEYILNQLIKKQNYSNNEKVLHLKAGNGLLININTLEIEKFDFDNQIEVKTQEKNDPIKIIDLSDQLSEIKTKYFRIGHMGSINRCDLLATIGAIETGLMQCNYNFESGAGLKAAQDILNK